MNQIADREKAPTAARYFIAAALPDEAKDRLAELQPPVVPGMRLIGRDEFHLTLHFLGELSPGAARAAGEALATFRTDELAIAIEGVGRFPPEGPVQVLWAGVKTNGPLPALHKSIAAALKGTIGYRSESRPYSPHVTLARLDPTISPVLVDGHLDKYKGFRIESVPIRELRFYSSTFRDNVPCYVEEVSVRLTSV
jgi:2'-5' RNA ligase